MKTKISILVGTSPLLVTFGGTVMHNAARTLVTIASLVAALSTTPALAQVWQASTDYSAVQGYRNWHYMFFKTSDSLYGELEYGFHVWIESWHAFDELGDIGVDIYPTVIHPGGRGHEAARVWQSPLAGTVRVTGTVAEADGSTRNPAFPADGVRATIWKNGELLYSQDIADLDLVGYSYDLTVDVMPGDWLVFRSRAGSNSYYDSTYFDPRISATPACPPSDMTAWWKLEETSGTTAADAVGSNDGTYIGSPLHITGKVGNALSFDGDDAVSLVGRSVAIQGNAARSIFAWVRTTYDGWQAVMATGTPADSEAFNLVVGFGGLSGNVGVMGYNNDFYPWSPRRVDDGQWHLIGATYDGAGTLKTYVDGSLDNIGYVTYATSGQNNYIGQSNHLGGNEVPFRGDIDEVMIFDRAVPPSEIAAMYAPPTYTAQVQPPINADGSSIFNVRRGVVPVKFTLADCNGHPTCTLPPATIAVTRTVGGVLGQVNESVYSGPSDTGSNFRIDGCQYIYNLNSNALGVGTYLVDILINGQAVGSATLQLK